MHNGHKRQVASTSRRHQYIHLGLPPINILHFRKFLECFWCVSTPGYKGKRRIFTQLFRKQAFCIVKHRTKQNTAGRFVFETVVTGRNLCKNHPHAAYTTECAEWMDSKQRHLHTAYNRQQTRNENTRFWFANDEHNDILERVRTKFVLTNTLDTQETSMLGKEIHNS